MSVTCDRCHKGTITLSHARIALDGFAVMASAWGETIRETPNLCSECVAEIAKNGEIVKERPLFESFEANVNEKLDALLSALENRKALSSPPSKKEGEL